MAFQIRDLTELQYSFQESKSVIEVFPESFTEFSEFSDITPMCHFRKLRFEPVTSWVRDQDADHSIMQDTFT